MRPRVLAASTATLIAAASMTPIMAQAAGQNTLFVNSASSACTDSGTGTSAAPYCTLQAAADAANPGDVLDVSPGTYAPTAFTRSGTAAAPITVTGNGVWNPSALWGLDLATTATAPLTFSGASHVNVEDFEISNGSAADAVVDGGSDITFEHDSFLSSATGLPAAHVTDGSSAVTLQDSYLGSGLIVDGGSTGTVVTTDRLSSSDMDPVSVVGAADTAITSNTINGCGPEVAVTDSATDTSIENNVVASPETAGTATYCPASATDYNILVDSSSAPTTTTDYNDVYNNDAGTGAADYDWAGTPYTSAAALYTAAAQAQHDNNSALGIDKAERSPLINSANSAAIGEQPTDINGDPRILDPLVTPTGAGPESGYDRGAYQFQDPLSLLANTSTASASEAPVGGTITLHAAATDTWSDTFDYQFKLSNGTTVDGGTSGSANVSFSTPGSYEAEVYLVPTNGAPELNGSVSSVPITVVPQAPLVPQLSAGAVGLYGVGVDDAGTTDSWNITGVTYDFGDGSPAETETSADTYATHTYAKAGTYTITETVTDAGGNTATTSTKFSTGGQVPGTLVNVVSGTTAATPAGSTGLIQSAVTSMPNNSSQLAAATTGGKVEFATGGSDGYAWQSWQTPSLPTGVTARWVGIAGMPNGSSQLIAISSTGQLWHTVRNANGTWQTTGWGSPTGSTGFVRASITAMPNGSSQLVAVTTTGVLMHNIRNANGSWQGWRALPQPGVKIVDASIAGLPDGSSQILEVTSTGVMKHNIRLSSGAWQATGWGIPKGFGSVKQVSISSTSVFGSKYGPGTTVMSVVNSAGAIENAFRNPDGSWDMWYDGTPQVASWGTAANSTITTQPDGSYVTLAVAGG
jgi:PKD domain/Right handed beta helix region